MSVHSEFSLDPRSNSIHNSQISNPQLRKIPISHESSLRLFFGFLLWSVSATLTSVLLITLGEGSTFSQILLGVAAVALEGTKILSWRRGGAFRIFAFFLISLSGIASLGASLQVVEKSKGILLAVSRETICSSPSYIAEEGELRSIDAEIDALVSRLQALPPDYTTATSRIGSSLDALRDRKQKVVASLGIDEPSGSASVDISIVALLGRTIGLRPDILLLVLLLFVSAAIEVGALLLTIPDHRTANSNRDGVKLLTKVKPKGDTSPQNDSCLRPSYTAPITPEVFLEAAMEGSDLPYLHGRDNTAEKLGIRSADAKRLVIDLLKKGRIIVKGKRLQLRTYESNAAINPVEEDTGRQPENSLDRLLVQESGQEKPGERPEGNIEQPRGPEGA